MDTSFVEQLRRRAETMLPPATVMRIECMADGGNTAMAELLEEVTEKGLRGEPLCTHPFRTVVYNDRVLLLCDGCPRMEILPRIAGIGYGEDKMQAEENAVYALTLPMDKPNTRHRGCIAAQQYGQGPVKAVRYACILNRVAYR